MRRRRRPSRATARSRSPDRGRNPRTPTGSPWRCVAAAAGSTRARQGGSGSRGRGRCPSRIQPKFGLLPSRNARTSAVTSKLSVDTAPEISAVAVAGVAQGLAGRPGPMFQLWPRGQFSRAIERAALGGAVPGGRQLRPVARHAERLDAVPKRPSRRAGNGDLQRGGGDVEVARDGRRELRRVEPDQRLVDLQERRGAEVPVGEAPGQHRGVARRGQRRCGRRLSAFGQVRRSGAATTATGAGREEQSQKTSAARTPGKHRSRNSHDNLASKKSSAIRGARPCGLIDQLSICIFTYSW